jgi:type VI secretion system secreted protein VgrG
MKPSFRMALRGVAAELLVLTVRGKEELGQLYRFEVRVAAGEELSWEAVLGVPADLHLAVGATVRHVTGIVTACEIVSRRSDGRQVLRLRVEPRLAALKHRSHWRIFHDRSVEEVLAEVLGDVGAPFAWRVSREVGRKPHRCQRGERDWAFVQRLLAEEALVTWFEAGEEGAELLVVSDRVESYPRLPCDVLRHVGPDPSLASLSFPRTKTCSSAL